MRGFLIGLVLALTCLQALAAATQTIHLKEYLGYAWSDELISYPLTGALKGARALTVTDETGAAVPCQLAAGRVYLLVNLGGEKQLCLRVSQPEAKPFLTLLYPRRPEEPAPAFTTLAHGDGVKIVLPGVTDYAFLAPV